MKKITISIDLASRQCGVVVRYQNEFKNYYIWVFEKWENKSNFFNYLHLKINEYILELRKDITIPFDSVDLVYELANFSNPLQTQRMAYIAGVICESLTKYFGKIDIYTFNANKWYYYFNKEYCGIQNWTKLPREKRKEFSINHFLKQNNIRLNFLTNNQLSDIADAYWIGKYYKEIDNEPKYTKSNGLKKR